MRFVPAFAACILMITMTAFASDDQPSSLRDSIIQAISRNNTTKSTDKLLDAVHYSYLATKQSALPSGALYCSATYSYSDTHYKTGSFNSSASSSACGVGVSFTIYDGGATRDRIKSAEQSEQATKYSFNTADSLIPYTKGGLAFSTMMNYVQMAMAREGARFATDVITTLQEWKKWSKDDSIDQRIKDYEQAKQEQLGDDEEYSSAIEFNTTLKPSAQLETLDQTIASLEIPPTRQEAEAIAMENSSDVLRRNAEVKGAEYDLKEVRATYGPHVSLNANVGTSGYQDYGMGQNNSWGGSSSIGIGITIPLDPSKSNRKKAAQSILEAKELERSAAIDMVKHTINMTYQKLDTAQRNYLLYDQNYKEQVAIIKNYTEQIRRGDTKSLDITKMLLAISTLNGRFSMRAMKQREIIMSKFSVVQATGLLFTKFAPTATHTTPP